MFIISHKDTSALERSFWDENCGIRTVNLYLWAHLPYVPLWAWRRPLVKGMCRITKTQLEVLGNSALDPWEQQPWTAVFTFPSRGQDGWSRFPLSKAGQLIQQGWLSCRDDLEFRVRDCPKCLSLQQRQILLTDGSTVTDRPTLQLFDWIGPVGPIQWKYYSGYWSTF